MAKHSSGAGTGRRLKRRRCGRAIGGVQEIEAIVRDEQADGRAVEDAAAYERVEPRLSEARDQRSWVLGEAVQTNV